jgi:hypothetical protein
LDPWTAHQSLKQFLELLPLAGYFIIGGAYTVMVARLAVKRAKKKWDADFLSRYKEEARSEIEERDAFILSLKQKIAELQEALKQEQKVSREMNRRHKAAIEMIGRLTAILSTAETIPMYLRGSG